MNTKIIKDLMSNPENGEEMPVLFVGHGSPMNAIEENEFSRTWKELGHRIPEPRAILCISAHWETKGTYVTVSPDPQTIHDFGGFPKELYEVQYPAPGSPELAVEVQQLIQSAEVFPDDRWGLDHGAWSVIRHMYPEAKIPVIEMSMDYTRDPAFHYSLAKELVSLRKKGVLIIGSGNIVHNLRLVSWEHANEPEYGFDWALVAREKLNNLILDNNHQELINYRKLGREIQLAVPGPDHFLPLLYTLALKDNKDNISLFNDKTIMGSLSMTGVRIGE